MSGEIQQVSENGELRPITPVEAEFLRMYFECGNVAEAAMASKLYKKKPGEKRLNAKISAASKGAKLLRLLAPQIAEMMAQAGLSPMEILRPLKEGMEATECHVVKQITKTGVGKDAVVVEKQELVQTPHYMARAKFVEMGLKVHQILVVSPPNVNVKAEANAQAGAVASARSDLKGKSEDELREIIDRENRARAAAGRFRKGA